MLSIFFFVIAGAILHGTRPTQVCPLYCLDVGYMTCPSSGHQRLPGKCNWYLFSALIIKYKDRKMMLILRISKYLKFLKNNSLDNAYEMHSFLGLEIFEIDIINLMTFR
ncbi:hypothetical protein AMTRI_Chr04g248080 [Amborella trichopoda]